MIEAPARTLEVSRNPSRFGGKKNSMVITRNIEQLNRSDEKFSDIASAKADLNLIEPPTIQSGASRETPQQIYNQATNSFKGRFSEPRPSPFTV